jgi:putative phosphonate metabolism protein
MISVPRYAIYYTPPLDSPWWRFGCRWLGRDAASGEVVPPPELPGLPTDWSAITAAPRRYGFHATLKAPFSLADESSERDLCAVAGALASGRKPFQLPALRVGALAGFVALQLTHGSPALELLAQDCVILFERCRAPLTPVEQARRSAADLSEWQAKLLARWGYPYVFDQYRFHMTLTAELPAARRQAIVELLAPQVERMNEAPPMVDAIAVFRQDAPDEPFRVAWRFGFDGSRAEFAGAG